MKPKQAILYARFSPRPNAKECDSIDKQFERLRAWCVATDTSIAAEYHDANKSGGSMAGRDGLDQALKHVCRIRGIFAVDSQSRLSRHVGHASTILERLDKKGVKLVMLQQRIDTTTPEGRCMFHVLAAFDQMYKEQLAARTSGAMLHHQANGRRMGRADRVPFGYRVADDDSREIIPDQDEQSIISMIVGLRTAGMSHRGICEELDDRCVSRRGNTWAGAHGLVDKILRRSAR